MTPEEATKERTPLANLAFIPTCSKCLTPVFDRVVGIIPEYAIDELYSSNRLYMEPYIEMHPKECPHCGARFKALIYPDCRALADGKMLIFTKARINKNLTSEEGDEHCPQT